MNSPSALRIVISKELKAQLIHYLSAYSKFANLVNIYITPNSDVHFSVVNENKSCFSGLRLPAGRLIRQIASDSEATDPIFHQAYPQALRALLHHLQRLQSCVDFLLLEFTKHGLKIGSEPCEGSTCTWRSNFEPTLIENPIHPALDAFPICIAGFSGEWFHFLLEAVGTAGTVSKSTLVLRCQQTAGLSIILPGNKTNRTEIQVAPFNFLSFRAPLQTCSIMLNLREMASLFNLATKMTSKIDLYFGPNGHPLIAILCSIGAFECKYILATVEEHLDAEYDRDKAVNNDVINDGSEDGSDDSDEYISGTDEEEL